MEEVGLDQPPCNNFRVLAGGCPHDGGTSLRCLTTTCHANYWWRRATAASTHPNLQKRHPLRLPPLLDAATGLAASQVPIGRCPMTFASCIVTVTGRGGCRWSLVCVTPTAFDMSRRSGHARHAPASRLREEHRRWGHVRFMRDTGSRAF